MRDNAGPVGEGDRVTDLDVLRGVALFGVFLANMTGFVSEGVMATGAQLAALPTAGADKIAERLIGWLVENKANTTFAFLFGLGFSLQLQRAEARGAAFERLYARRLLVLLVFGFAHLTFLWVWDILHLYALAGFALLALRRASDRTLLWIALPLLLLHWRFIELAGPALGFAVGSDAVFSDAAVTARQAASLAGDYPALFAEMWRMNWVDYFLSGQIVGWFFYALGRFAMGAWVGRKGWLQNAGALLPGFRRAASILLPAGLASAGLAELMVIGTFGERWETIGKLIQPASAVLLAAGYISAIVVALRTPLGHRLLAPFRWSGRMALSNYVMQSLIYAFILFSVGPGLALAGHIGTCAAIAIVCIAYAGQIALSAWWLARWRFGPLEWAWRALTYGEHPAMRGAVA